MADPTVISLGLSNALRTGNVALDMALSTLICVVVPCLLTSIFTYSKDWLLRLYNHFFLAKSDRVTREVVTKSFRSTWGEMMSEDKNHILIKAILMHVKDSRPEWLTNVDDGKITLLDTQFNEDEQYQDEDDESEESRSANLSYMERQLRALKLTSMPRDGVEVEVEKNLFLSISEGESTEDGEDKKRNQSKTMSLNLFSVAQPRETATTQIDTFIEKAYASYQLKAASKNRNKRFMLSLAARNPVPSSSEEKKSSSMLYTKYTLAEEKTFESLFIPQKQELLRLLDDFTEKKGKFAIKGFPQKLGLLLHGPPGTGKTSLIKAIAQHTGRHLVSIPLKRIKTNEELMELMFSGQFAVTGEDMPLRLPFKKIIFTLEDVDAASDIVRHRDTNNSAALLAARLRPAPLITPTPSSSSSEDGEETEPASMNASATTTTVGGGKMVGASYKWFEPDDELDLAGLLNALDGVVDCPGRIVIMTTNHPEKLDPALIRPGRINMKLHLDYLRAFEAIQMVEHYSNTKLTQTQADKFRAFFDQHHQITPAELEECCAESDHPDHLVDILKHKHP
eukprot:c5180_g1_i1.p1 GENE.c5180_g1_i1~~c5180_g1_i1.p1  ORF type:complete len:583 (+),score=136.36 c5180_g1_i1:54-1751(+)